ncbi:peptidylprolyl isomerase [Desulfuromonas sp. AOP6]|uniref:FKBP-type peptidyl-prolyl cis-trans isomerase n=1 Tax=Desulfuromonas sp. AOP6 TaxID=1566351 RepID=UPI001270D0F6|nr:peptidylprolyl isomerase [Desulfuromonas sp. AOP6]BCA80624.1 peptidyl-prolyl cis-trans isomerase [Desulfuromonas sp. AOP6]
MAAAKSGDSIKVHYAGRLEDGTAFDSSKGGEPLSLTLGQGEVIPGFDEAIVGMQVGESKTITIGAEQAYGPRIDELVIELARKDLPGDLELTLGRQLEVTQEEGEPFVVEVTDLTDVTVTLDANHPLAGKELTFDIELVEIL